MPYRTPGKIREEEKPTFFDLVKGIYAKGAIGHTAQSAKREAKAAVQRKKEKKRQEKKTRREDRKFERKHKKLLKCCRKRILAGAADGEQYISVWVNKYDRRTIAAVEETLRKEGFCVRATSQFIDIGWTEEARWLEEVG